MLFGSFTFLFLIAALCLALPHARRKVWLVAGFSLAFYSALSLWYLLLLLATAGIDFAAAHAIDRHRARARPILAVSLSANLGVLAFFKYAGFAAAVANDAGRLLGADFGLSGHDYPLPIGISFYTFQSIAYVVDVYRGRAPAIRRFDNYLLYVSFFPQILAGPIERAAHLYPQIERLDRMRTDWQGAAPLLVRGFAKKMLVADNLSAYVERVFHAPAEVSLATLAFATLCFGIQIYCDFSGYTDIARGLARGIGIDLARNFDRPYSATSVTEFWRRWHMSLSGWLRDYVYIPLGGSRGGPVATYRNLLATMVLAGLWHGASYNFLLWGLAHGCALAVERFARHRFPGFALPRPVAWVATMVFVFAGWYLFRVGSLADILVPFDLLMSGNPGQRVLPGGGVAFALALFGLGALVDPRQVGARWSGWRYAAAAAVAYAFLPPAYQTFIYFQF